jgi:uncharacterized membrane protein
MSRKNKPKNRTRRLHGFTRFAVWTFVFMIVVAVAGGEWSSHNKNPVTVFGLKLSTGEKLFEYGIPVIIAIIVLAYIGMRGLERVAPIHQGDNRDEFGNPPRREEDLDPPFPRFRRRRLFDNIRFGVSQCFQAGKFSF